MSYLNVKNSAFFSSLSYASAYNIEFLASNTYAQNIRRVSCPLHWGCFEQCVENIPKLFKQFMSLNWMVTCSSTGGAFIGIHLLHKGWQQRCPIGVQVQDPVPSVSHTGKIIIFQVESCRQLDYRLLLSPPQGNGASDVWVCKLSSLLHLHH